MTTSMIFVARQPFGPPQGAGVLGLATSPDLIHWTVNGPIFKGCHYGEMEVPQIFSIDGWWYCLFSNSVRHRLPAYIASGKCGRVTGTHYLRSQSPDGPFELVEELFFAGDEAGHLYGGRTIEDENGQLVFLAFLNHRSDMTFVGTISDPMPVWTTPDGFLRIDARNYGMALRDAPVRPREPVCADPA